jgi:hypothetical protein
VGKELFCDRTAYDSATSKRSLKMHRLPNGPRFDVLTFEVLANRGRPNSEMLFVEYETRQPACRVAAGRFRHELDPTEAFERLVVGTVHRPTLLDELIEPGQLGPAERS